MILKKLLKNKKWMTLIELMLSMAIFALIMTMIMTSVNSMMLARVKNMNRIALTDELYFFSEQLFTAIKNGGTLDYEEYWNRKAYDMSSGNGHYTNPTGVGNFGFNGNIAGNNFWNGLYYCRSESVTNFMWTSGCLSSSLNNSWNDQKWTYQRYGQYEQQFWDYNANNDSDGGDQNRDGNMIWDEDDRNLWDGPEVFSWAIHELYLINNEWWKSTRTFFRWNITQDPGTTETCSPSKDGEWNFTATGGCLGNIQILKLKGLDRGFDHRGTWAGAFDGKIDTWVCEAGWDCQWENISSVGKIATGWNAEWKNLFPNSISVRKFRLDAFPKKDPWLSAAAPDCQPTDRSCISPFIHPYVRFSLELGFSHGARRAIKGEDPIISLSTTISLDDFR